MAFSRTDIEAAIEASLRTAHREAAKRAVKAQQPLTYEENLRKATVESLLTAQEEEQFRQAIAESESMHNLTKPDTSNDAAIAAELQNMLFDDTPVQYTPPSRAHEEQPSRAHEEQPSQDTRAEMRKKCSDAREKAKVVPASQAMREHAQCQFYKKEIRQNCSCNRKPPTECPDKVGWWLGEMLRVERGCQYCMWD